MRAVAKHSPELAQAVVDSGALESLVVCLEEFDPSVKEAAAWALGYIAGHTGELAQAVVEIKYLLRLLINYSIISKSDLYLSVIVRPKPGLLSSKFINPFSGAGSPSKI